MKKRHNAVLGLIFMIIVAGCINRSFLSLENLTNVLRQASMNGMIAVGMTMVIICGSIDLSVGAMIGLCGYIALYFSNHNLGLAIAVPLLTGILVGSINGFLINKIKIAPFIATLSTMMAVKGVTLVLTNENTYFAPDSVESFQYIGRGLLAPYITVPSLLFVCCAIAGAYIIRHTTLGRNMYAVGGNEEAAKMMGVNVKKTIMFSHIFTSMMAALAGITLASRVGAAYPLAGEGKELDVIAACVIGGTALTGGKGNIPGTFIGVLIMGMLTNIFNMQSLLNPFWEKVIIGILVLIVVLIQSISENGVTIGNRFKKDLLKGKI